MDPRDKYESLRYGIYTIEGIIGVGKTTLGKSLEKFLNEIGIKTKFYPEYVNKDLLEQYIKNMRQYAYSFQLVMLFKRLEIYREAVRFSKKGGVALIDRSIIGDITFARMQKDNGNFTLEEWNVYLSLIKQDMIKINEKHFVENPLTSYFLLKSSIYLKCSSRIALQRINNRGIDSEVNGYSIEYLDQLNEAYEKSIAEHKDINHIVLNWDDNINIKNNYLEENNMIEILDLLIK